MTLSSGSLLKHGEYRIVRVLGQGGFGITYEAEQVSLGRRVAVKEFFMKDCCNRDGSTSHVSVPSVGSRELVEKFRLKFVREARMIAGLDHEHIVRVFDVFEENGTAYYVMEYFPGGSLADGVKRGEAMSEGKAIGYVRQVADALQYLHLQNILHFDVKPSNVLLGKNGSAKLIDFGISKHYDESGSQTSSTPIGISKGFAPLEQYKQGSDIKSFTPATDVYSLGATLYALLAGQTPPEASDVNDDGLPVIGGVSSVVMRAIECAMQPKRKNRPQSVAAFLQLLDEENTGSDDDEDTLLLAPTPTPSPTPTPTPSPKWLWPVVAVLVVGAVTFGLLRRPSSSSGGDVPPTPTTVTTTTTSTTTNDKPSADATYANGILTVKGVTYKMVRVSGGTFTMGATAEMTDPFYDEEPTHQGTLSSYRLGETEVTQALWTAVMGSNPSNWKGDDLPVEEVSWNDCQTFLAKLNALTGRTFRLPTEAEWEYAAHGGSKSSGTQYSGSSNLGEVAWHDGNSGSKTHPVKTKKANELGLYDMTGNVWEWCQDRYGSYSSSAQTNPTGPSSGSYRVFRGGSWFNVVRNCRSSNRGYSTPGYSFNNLGFRLALSE